MGAGLAAFASQPPGAPAAQLTYVKVFKGSVPEYMAITVDTAGRGTYDGRKLSDPPHPAPITLSPSTTARLFALARELDDFKSITLESRKKVANMGHKTFIYEQDGQRSSVEFNYTENRLAQELTDLFEGIANVEEHVRALEYAARYDPLGLPRQLAAVESDLEKKDMTDPELLTGVLKEIAGNSRFLHIAQVRAQDILEKIQSN